jgi:hypothetical protein
VVSNIVRRMGMKSIVYVIVGICLVALSACGSGGPSGETVTKAEDVVGVWHRTKGWLALRSVYMQMKADGTMGFGVAPDKWDYAFERCEFTFDGTECSVTETASTTLWDDLSDWSCVGTGHPSGVYEVQLLTNGNLKFVNAQDGCGMRKEILTIAEWEPVQ